MVVKKTNLIGIALLLTLVLTPVSTGFAQGGNNLVQLDLKRASNDSVNVTLFTSNSYNDNVLVRKKSDNKYVILIPKVQSSGYSNPSLYGVKDLVSNIDVKTVNDTSGGYTKVTLITTKPLDIKTSTRQSGPVTEEQKEYKTLIAEANAIKNNIAKPQQPVKQIQPKTEITVNKASVQPEKTVQNKNTNASIKEQPKEQLKVVQTKEQQKKTSVQPKSETKPNIELKEISNDNLERQARREHLAQLIKEVKQEQLEKQVPDVPITVTDISSNQPAEVKNINEMPKIAGKSANSSVKTKIKNVFNRIPKKFGLITGSLFVLLILSRFIKALAGNNSVKQTSGLQSGIRSASAAQNKDKYSNITNNKELSWQEKYQQYLDASARPVSRGKNKGNYTFIKTPAQPDAVAQKRSELEKLLEEMPVYNNNIQPEIVEDVHSEDTAIQNTIKFKAFDHHRPSLQATDRNKVKSRFKKYEVEIPLHEQKTVDLGTSPLHTNPRSLKDANLNIADVDKNRIKYKPTEYIMSSVDEYFSILDKEQKAAPVVEQQTVIPQMRKTGIGKQTNPISKSHNETKSSYLNSLIIKSGYNIDDKKGFYMVNLDGKSALIGKVNDEITVLKKYDKVIDKPVQVRHDNANVYMVKAEGFKSLVEVNDDKMGVLIEL